MLYWIVLFACCLSVLTVAYVNYCVACSCGTKGLPKRTIAAKAEVELQAPALAVWLTVDGGGSEQLVVAVVQLAHFSDAVSSESTASTRQTRDGIGEGDRQSKAVGGRYDGNGAPGRGRRTEGQYALRSSTARVGPS